MRKRAEKDAKRRAFESLPLEEQRTIIRKKLQEPKNMKKWLILTTLTALLLGACSTENEVAEQDSDKQTALVQKEDKKKSEKSDKEKKEKAEKG